MALLLYDGFNDGPAGIALRYTTSGVAGMAANPLTGRAVRLVDGEYLTRAIPFGDTTAVIGFAFRADYSPPSGSVSLLSIMEGATAHLTLSYDCATRTLRLHRGDGTLLGSGSIALPVQSSDYSAWRYVEIKASIDNAGSVQVRIADAADINFSGDTQNGATGTPDAITLGDAGANGQAFAFDDFYSLDGTGTQTDFLGQYTTISPVSVQGSGTFSSWLPSSGASWECVDELDPNLDTDYVESTTRGNLETYTTGGFYGAPKQIYAVQVSTVARADSVDPLVLRNTVTHDSVEQPGISHTLTSTYASYTDVFERDPYTSANWTVYGISQLQIGLEDGAEDFERFVTSRPYPLAPLEKMGVSVSFMGGYMHGWPSDDTDISVDLYSGSLYALSSTHAQPAESADVAVDLSSGGLTVLLVTQSQPAESADITLDLTSGTLEVKLVNYTFYPAESTDVAVDLTSGTLV